ncbi:hypothetical protein [Mycolicibacterium aichiense]|uniref:Uncharacterized protein n=1 Tax=Mycolicibacterium aichiense TaxID=1799 RepID=A0AAD1HSD4_9MYCO|nr:hypothetical protein [Mycolicibacterium aichiense]MCV7016132.1 hypothetical protein [Mycolicibacterium aichiense]BBX10104.1 hypothetical protein MAIC_49070 [Mycolicibacterium aichiense]STZ26230.1 Uncharacterised protein [Mycolicibacterium aichiense]
MDNDSTAKFRKPAAVIAAVAISTSALFAGTAVSAADPFGDDDGGGSSYSGGDDGGSAPEAPSGGGMEEPSDGGMQQEPAAPEPPAGAPHDEPGGIDMPGGGLHDEPGGAEPAPGAPAEDPAGTPEAPGGMPAEPGSGEAPTGGGTNEAPGTPAPAPGGGTNEAPGTQEPTTAGGLAEPAEPQVSQEDITTALASEVETTTSTEVTSEEVTTYQESVSSTVSTSTMTTGMTLSSPVTLWNSSWITYDRFYRPVFTNPYRTPLSVLYDYGGSTQVFTVPPLQRAALNVPNTGTYNFTAMTRPASGPATNLSVGSFSGGGYQPGPGQPPPQKPAPVNTQKNVLVQVKFDRGQSEPFRVSSLTDLGKDPAVNNTTKVLLDEEVPAWGEWSKTDKGDALFVINQTQLLPGIQRPAQEPLPGYNVKLTAASHSTSWIDKNRTVLISVAVAAGVLALAVVGFMVVSRRRGTGG